jgi:hypothetical protein
MRQSGDHKPYFRFATPQKTSIFTAEARIQLGTLSDYPVVGEIHGSGLLQGIDIIKPDGVLVGTTHCAELLWS